MPDGSISHEKNVDFVIDINEIDCAKNIVLEATSKNGKRSSTVTKSVKIKEGILPSDYFSFGNVTTVPKEKYSSSNSSNWIIYAANNNPSLPNNKSIQIFFPGTSKPSSSGVYELKDSSTNLSQNQACVIIHEQYLEDDSTIKPLNGQMNVTITSNGRIRLVFNNINAIKNTFSSSNTWTSYLTISGDITCY